MSLKSNFVVENKYGAFYTGGKVQITDDGCQILCQCDISVKVVDVSTGKVIRSLEEEEDVVNNFILSPDNEVLIVAYKSLVLRHWNWKEGKVERKWKSIHIAPITTMGFDATSTLLATGSADSTVKIWDTFRKQCTNNLRDHTGVVSVAEFHPDVKRLQLVTSAGDNKIRVWQLKTSSCQAVLEGHYSTVTALRYTSDGNTMFSAGRDSVVIIWCLKNLIRLNTIPVFESLEGLILLPLHEKFPSIEVRTDDQYFVTAGSQGLMKVWNAAKGHCVFQQKLAHVNVAQKLENQEAKEDQADEKTAQKSFEITDLMYNTALDTITTITYDHNILMYNRSDLSLKKQFVGYSDEIIDIKYVSDTYIAMATNSELLKVMNMDTGMVQILRGHHDLLMCISMCKHDYLLGSASKDGVIFLWQLVEESGSMNLLAEGQGHTHAIGSIAFSQLNASFMVSGSYDQTLKMWPLPSGMSGSSKTNLVASMTERAHDKDINSVAVSPNDKLIATGSGDKTAKVWGVDGLRLLGVCRGHTRGVWCVKFSPVDQCIATSSGDCSIKIWALSDYSCVKTFEGHESSVLNISFISRGMQIVSSGSEGLVKLWTLKTNECVCTLDEHTDKAWALSVNSREDRMVSGGADSVVIEWKDVTEIEQEEARAKQEDVILKEQEIQNLLQQKKYLKALKLAINMDQPFRVFNIIKGIMVNNEGDTTQLDATLVKLQDYQIDSLLRYAVSWNTNSKNCHVAQHVISLILKTHTVDELMKLGNFKSSLEGLIPYTERHAQRMNRLQQQSTFLDYTWQCMRLVAGAGFEEAMESTSMETDTRDKSANMPHILEKAQNASSSESESASESESESEDKKLSSKVGNILTVVKNVETKNDIRTKTENMQISDSSSESDSDDENLGKISKANTTSFSKLVKESSSDQNKKRLQSDLPKPKKQKSAKPEVAPLEMTEPIQEEDSNSSSFSGDDEYAPLESIVKKHGSSVKTTLMDSGLEDSVSDEELSDSSSEDQANPVENNHLLSNKKNTRNKKVESYTALKRKSDAAKSTISQFTPGKRPKKDANKKDKVSTQKKNAPKYQKAGGRTDLGQKRSKLKAKKMPKSGRA